MTDRDALLDRIVSEYLMAEEVGTAPAPHVLLDTYPELRAELESFLEDHHRLRGAAEPLRDLLSSDVLAEPPSSWGDYELLEEIGRGGMGVVFKARQRSLDRVVALKMLLGGHFASGDSVRRFQVEAQAAARLDHPHLVPIHDVGTIDGHHYYTMALIEGQTLAAELRQGPFAPERAATCLLSLATAVAFAHRKGVLHRDLKPANVLLDAEGKPRITDFGLAKWLEAESDLTATGQVVGTPSYMAPEQCGQLKDGDIDSVGRAADIYALGAILYALLVGRPPFQAFTPWQTIQQVLHQEPVPPRQLNPEVPRDLQTVCLKCLDKSPDRRYESAELLAGDLRRFLEGQPILARPANLAERTLKWCRRRPAVAGLFAVSGLALLVLVAGGILHVRQVRTQIRRVQSEKQRADHNYQEARDALRRIVSRLNDQRLVDVPSLQDLRRQMLEDALEFYESVLNQQARIDAGVRMDAAVTLHETGSAQLRLGRPDDALTNFRKAIRLLEELHTAAPERTDYAAQLAAHLNNLGVLQMRRDGDEAEATLNRALDLRTRLAGQGLDESEHPLAESHHNLGAFLQLRGRPDEARTHFERAIALRDGLRDQAPEDVELAAGLAESLVNLGLLHHGFGRLESAESAFSRADRLLRQAIERDPLELSYRVSLADNLLNWGNLKKQRRELTEALASYDEAIETLQEVLRREPGLERAERTELNCRGARAALLQVDLARPGDAVPDWQRVVELAAPARKPQFRLYVALAAATSGDLPRALEAARQLDGFAGLQGPDCYNLACVYARCAQGDELSQSNRKELTELALESLRRSHALGYLRASAEQTHLRQDPDLTALHGLPAWTEFVNALETAD